MKAPGALYAGLLFVAASTIPASASDAQQPYRFFQCAPYDKPRDDANFYVVKYGGLLTEIERVHIGQAGYATPIFLPPWTTMPSEERLERTCRELDVRDDGSIDYGKPKRNENSTQDRHDRLPFSMESFRELLAWSWKPNRNTY